MPNENPRGGVIDRVLPRGLYRVVLENGGAVTVSLSRTAARLATSYIAGQQVQVRLSPFDRTRGVIIRSEEEEV